MAMATALASIAEPGKAITEDAIRNQFAGLGDPGKMGRWDAAKVKQWVKQGQAKIASAQARTYARMQSLPRNAYTDQTLQRSSGFYRQNPQYDPAKFFRPSERAKGNTYSGAAPITQQADKWQFMPGGGSPLEQMFPSFRGGTQPGGMIGGPGA